MYLQWSNGNTNFGKCKGAYAIIKQNGNDIDSALAQSNLFQKGLHISTIRQGEMSSWFVVQEARGNNN